MASDARSDVTVEILRAAAYRTLKVLLPRLVSGIPPDAICDMLYANSVIKRERLELATNQQLPSRDRTRSLILALQTAVESDHTLFEKFCACLEDEGDVGLFEIAKRLRGNVVSEWLRTPSCTI